MEMPKATVYISNNFSCTDPSPCNERLKQMTWFFVKKKLKWLLQWDVMNIPLKAADGLAVLSLPGNTEIIGQRWKKKCALMSQLRQFRISNWTSYSPAFCLRSHSSRKKTHLCSLTCAVINVLIMIFPLQSFALLFGWCMFEQHCESPWKWMQ